MVNQAIWLAMPTLIFSIVIMWESIVSMLFRKSISDFLSFFLLSVVLALYTGAIVFELFFNSIWMALESAILLNLIWVFVNIWREDL